MTVIVLVLAGVLGLLIGSFLNVVAYRVPAGLSVVRPASACPGCHTEIAARDNIPVLSWMLLRGRCRTCGMAIAARYPIVEASTAAAFVLAALPFSSDLGSSVQPAEIVASVLETTAFLYFAAVSVVLVVIDIDVKRLPDAIVLPSFGVGAALLGGAGIARGDLVDLAVAAAGAGGATLFFFLLAVARPGGMGLGDVKLAGVLGLFLGYLGVEQLVVGIAAGFLLGGVFGTVLLLSRRVGRRSALPFGPWMLAGAWVGILAGPAIAQAYLRTTGLA